MNNFNEIRKPNFIQPTGMMNERMKMEMPKPQIKTEKKSLGMLGVLGILGVVGVLGALGILGAFNKNSFVKSQAEWQAVFLTNGETYFGKVAVENENELVLENVFYLQNKEPLQQGALLNKQTGDIALIKLGKELHGPMDRMKIVRTQVLYIEDMKLDSKIVKAIDEYLKK